MPGRGKSIRPEAGARQRPRASARNRQDKFQEHCGVFGVFNHSEASNLTYLGLYALQHRGQEGAGITATDGKVFFTEKGIGLVADIFSEKRLKRLPGHIAIGHNRYSTAGGGGLKNVQPIVATFSQGSLAIAHNGNLVNAATLREELEGEGAIFQSTSDTEVLLHLMARSKSGGFRDKLREALLSVTGSYSILIMRENELIAARDPYGIRPLSLGMLDGSYVVGSETCAFDLIGAKYLRDIEPGEMIFIGPEGIESERFARAPHKAFCVFEYIYFARPDSYIFGGTNVNEIRKNFGRELAKSSPVDADIVIPVPDSGVPAALGFAEQSGLPFDFGLIRNHYVGRTFIEPKQSIRHFGVKIKLNPVRSILEGKRVVVVDDSIVRGTTSKKIVKMIREGGGAKEVHMRISSPPCTGPCFYGIDTPTRGELIANTHSIEEIKKYITADSLSYMDLEAIKRIVPGQGDYCAACFDNHYPMHFPGQHLEQLDLML